VRVCTGTVACYQRGDCDVRLCREVASRNRAAERARARARTAPPVPDESWRGSAACTGKPTAWWFPEPDGRVTGLEAREVCATCPVAAQCLAWAEQTGQDHGLWGGLSVSDRQAGRSPQEALERARASAGVPCAECGERFKPKRKGHRFCSPLCAHRRRERDLYANDPEHAERKRQQARAYHDQYGDYVRARKRRLYQVTKKGSSPTSENPANTGVSA
jgi:WhiB family transcriptional regulator, redox-sensing transcriptional regulator